MTSGCALVEKCMEAYSQKLVGYAYAICGNSETAKDAVQDTFISLCRQKQIDENKAAHWLFKVCRNKVYDSLRKEKYKSPLPDCTEAVSENPVPHQELSRNEIAKILAAKIKELPSSQREILYLRFFEEKSYEEISEILDMPKNSVGTTISRGLENLEKKLNRKDFYES